MDKISLVIVEDDPGFGEVLRLFARAHPEFVLTTLFTSVEKLIEGAPELKAPDIVLMDIMLPGMSGIEGVSETLKFWPDTKIIMNSILNDNDAIYRSLKSGAMGYVTKDMPLSAIKEAIICVHNGGSYMNPQIARKVVEYFQKPLSVREILTEKEWNIANGIKDGLSYKLVADQNDMSIDGVRFYIQRIYRKLNINSRGELTNILNK
jgi:DNA-binding NarL/FixJ family response regulator